MHFCSKKQPFVFKWVSNLGAHGAFCRYRDPLRGGFAAVGAGLLGHPEGADLFKGPVALGAMEFVDRHGIPPDFEYSHF